jgi:predicted NBD/HSP70 family sugar kinase
MILVFDIGGSQMRFARSDTQDVLGEPVIVPTPAIYEEAIGEAVQIIATLAKGEPITKIVGGIAGTLDPRTHTLHASPNMRAWIGKHIQKDLERLTGAATVIIKNDADMAGLGEALFGAGRGYAHVAYMTISTGVGGSYVVNGKVLETRYGAEPGHQIINDQTGETLEEVIGGRNLEKKYDKKPKELGEDMYAALTKRLAVGVHNVIQLWSPDVVVLGGSQMRDISVEQVHAEVTKLNVMFPYVPDVVAAELGSSNGLFGALAFAKQMD